MVAMTLMSFLKSISRVFRFFSSALTGDDGVMKTLDELLLLMELLRRVGLDGLLGLVVDGAFF